MYILSLIITTLTSVINAGTTIIALNGGFTTSYTNTMAGVLPRTVLPLIYGLILPTVLTFFILSFTLKSSKGEKKPKSALFLKISLGLTLLQALVSIIIYQLNYSTLISPEIVDFNPAPFIIEAAVIFLTFIGSVICAIKATSTGEKTEFSSKSALFALTALSLGALELILDLIPVIIFRIDRNNGITQSILQWTEYLRMLNPAIFGLALINSVRKFDKYTILAWIGVLLAFSARAILYTIAYI